MFKRHFTRTAPFTDRLQLLIHDIIVSQTNPQEINGLPIDVTLKFHDEVSAIYYQDSSKYAGLLDQGVAQTLRTIVESFPVALYPFLVADKSTDLTSPKALPEKDRLVLNVVIYGFNYHGRAIGNILSENNAYLQHTRFHDRTLFYANPHYLLKPGSSIVAPEIDDSAPVLNLLGAQASVLEQAAIDKDDIIQVFNSAQGPPVWAEPKTSPRLKTDLKRYVPR